MRNTLSTLRKMVQDGEKIVTLTCYDASFARLMEEAGVDMLLVGDSLGMVLQGHETTLPVTMGDMEYHVKCVARGSTKALIVADMPFGSYQENPEQAFDNAARLMRAGAQMVKIEGGKPMVDTVRFLTERGIPVFAHLGLTPQAVHQLGGFRVQGKNEVQAAQMMEDAKALRDAGASLLLLEAVPSTLAKQITEEVGLPTIGIGAGVDCSGQVLVVYDMLGVYHYMPKFAKNFMEGAGSIQGAVSAYVKAVKDKIFPAPEHTF